MKTDGNTSMKRGMKQNEYVQGIKAVDQSLKNLHTHTQKKNSEKDKLKIHNKEKSITDNRNQLLYKLQKC